MLSIQQHPSAIASPCNQLAAGHIANLTDSWCKVESPNVPLVTPAEGVENKRGVTFPWRARHPLQGVHLRLDRVTNREHAEKGIISALPEIDIWTLTLRLPVSYCGSYLLLKIPPGATTETTALLGGRFAVLAGKADPLNRMPEIDVRGNVKESVLTLDEALALSEWNGGFHTEQLLTSMRIIAGKSRQARFYIPDVDTFQPLGLVMLSDGETQLGHLGICVAIDATINNGHIVSVAVLGIGNINEYERVEVLGGRSRLTKDIVGRLLSMTYAEQPQRQWADRSCAVLAGQSFGGTSVPMRARYAPETFGLVLNHPPSVWWTPERTSQPGLFSGTDTPWMSEHLLSTPPQGMCISLCVESLEGSTVPHAQQFHQRLTTAGVESHCAVCTGGHSYTRWRGTLIDGIGLLQD